MSSNEDEQTIRTLLPLEQKDYTYSNDRRSKYKALSDPNDNNSVKYDFNVNHCEGNEGLCEAIKYYLQINKLAGCSYQPE